MGVDFQTFESAKVPGVHVIGDATAAAPGMPKSGFMANNHAKVASDSVIALLTGAPVNREPILTNTCYSFVSDKEAVHVASVHKVGRGAEDSSAGGWRRRRVDGTQRAGRRIRAGLGAQHLVRHAGLSVDARAASIDMPNPSFTWRGGAEESGHVPVVRP